MNAFAEFVAWTLRALLRLLTLALLASFVVGVLVLGITVALLSVLWSLLRGKRPAMFTVFRTFQQASGRFRRGPGTMPWPRTAANQDEVVDVQAHEVREVLGQRPEQ